METGMWRNQSSELVVHITCLRSKEAIIFQMYTTVIIDIVVDT